MKNLSIFFPFVFKFCDLLNLDSIKPYKMCFYAAFWLLDSIENEHSKALCKARNLKFYIESKK